MDEASGHEPAEDTPFAEEEDGVSESETDADYRARMMHVDTFLRLNESINSLQVLGRSNPEYEAELQDLLGSAVAAASSGPTVDGNGARGEQDGAARFTTVKAHAHLIYLDDSLQLSKETIKLNVSERDMALYGRIIRNSKRLIMGTYTDDDVALMRRDHDLLIAMWDGGAPGKAMNIDGEMKNMMRCMLDTPFYYTNSCMNLIACGRMLRGLHRNETEGAPLDTYEDLMAFVRTRMRHQSGDPFECDCGEDGGERCSDECKTLMSMIMELPVVVHSQTYLLQILAYLMYGSAHEEVFINNLKNTCSPGLLDKIPTRLAVLLGTLDGDEIRRHYRDVRRQIASNRSLAPASHDRTTVPYSKNAIDRIVRMVHSPAMRSVIDTLPGARAAAVELHLPKCGEEKTGCLNRDRDEATIMRRECNNNGKNKCCGYLRQDPFDILVSSVSLAQLLMYVLVETDSESSRKARRHYFVRDIITSMARQTVKVKPETLEEMFAYLDRMSVFKGLNESQFLMSALHELFTSYIEYMMDAAKKYKDSNMKRRVKRFMRKNGVPDGTM